MGLIAETVKSVVPRTVKQVTASVPVWQNGVAQLPDSRYMTYAREGYARNEIVFACIEELSTSAAEPRMMFRRGQEWFHEGPIIDVIEKPNPFMDRYEYYATVIMHRSLAGNAYGLKVRSRSGKVIQRWLMRPDRVRVVPDREKYIRAYDYDIGDGQAVRIPASDVIHYRARHPYNDWYGMPPLMAASGRTDIDNYMADFVKSFFENAGVPGGILTYKAKIDDDQKDEIRSRFRETVNGPRGWHNLLIVDNNEASYTPMTLSLGERGLVIPELDEIEEARIPMVFGVPQSLIGTRTSYQNGGYANKRAEEQHFWTGTLAGIYKEISGKENISLVPDFAGVDEVAFDMSDVRALQEDQDKVHARARANAQAGIWSVQEARRETGMPPEPDAKHIFLVPSASEARPGDELEEPPASAPALPSPRPPAASADDDEDEED